MDETTVLIVGAGPVGLLTGMLLQQLDIDFRIVEQRAGLHDAPQAHVISSRSLEICRALGLADDSVRALGPAPGDTRFVRWVDRLAGRDLGVFDIASDEAAVLRMLTQSPTPTTNLGQDKFEQLLFSHLDANDRVLFATAWKSCSLNESGDYLSTVETADGERLIRSRYLIGADGAGSSVRKSLGVEMVGPDNLQAFASIHFRADLRKQLTGREALLYWVMDETVDGVFIAHDIDREWIYMKTIPSDQAAAPLDAEVLGRLLHDAVGADVPIEIMSMGTWRMTAQIAAQYQSGRVYLVGDAAHRFPPTGGIGMNTGFQDAHNLVWKIGMAERGYRGLLETYGTERKPVAEANSAQSLGNARKMLEVARLLDVNGDGHVLRADLEAVLADPARLAAVQAAVDNQAAHFNMSGLDLGFCYSGAAVLDDGPAPISADPVSCYLPSTTPGARLPHAPLLRDGETISTLDLVPYDALLILGHAGRDMRALEDGCADLPVRTAWVGEGEHLRPEGEAFRALFPEDELLIVRPDGHIGARLDAGASGAVVRDCLERLLAGRRAADG